MIKLKRMHALFFLLVILAVIVSGCAKPECKTSADCGQRACYISKCEEKKCLYTLQRNCCGNGINESTESGRIGSQCTCPQDYGRCEGRVKIRIGSRTEDAQYVKYYCNSDSQCVLGADRKDAAPQNFLDSINTGLFKASSVVKYSKPFDASRDSFEFSITLDDLSRDIVLPILITHAKILYSSEYSRAELLIADKELNSILNGVGDKATIILPLTLNYRPQEVEEQGSIRYSIDYTYRKQVVAGKGANNTNIYSNETARASFTAPVKPVFFVRSD
ncbi:hypothetical protein HYV80_06820 [Candidatus Woesearchaeota archaeon]|nr:hypothetical protein [Candidatus Woesearchaeota archaeon]